MVYKFPAWASKMYNCSVDEKYLAKNKCFWCQQLKVEYNDIREDYWSVIAQLLAERIIKEERL